jgi:23S rRNA (cytosine1962-C5)-methyltransferase
VAEVANAGIEQIKPLILDSLRRELRPRLVYFSNDLPARRLEQLTTEPDAVGEGPPATTILENGLRFEVDPASGQKTGFFLDQRENRALTRSLAAGRRVLNLFSYTGAFGVYAAAGGATFVDNVDGSEVAIEQAAAIISLTDWNRTLDSPSPMHSSTSAAWEPAGSDSD